MRGPVRLVRTLVLLPRQNLMSKLVKELPSDPIEFLITKLQTLQKQKRKVERGGGRADRLAAIYNSAIASPFIFMQQ